MDPIEGKSPSLVKGEHLGRGIACVLVGGAGWGVSGTCAQYLFGSYGVNPQWLVSVRMLLAGIFFLALALVVDRQRLVRCLTTPSGIGGVTLFSLCGTTFCSLCYLKTISLSNAGTATVLQSLNLVIIMTVLCVRLKRGPTRKELVGVALATVGTFLIATHGSLTSLAIAPDALGWGLATAVAAALYTLLPGRVLREYGSLVVTGLAMLIGGAFTGVAFQTWQYQVVLPWDGLLALAGVVVLGTMMSFLLYLEGVKLVGSMLAGLFGCAEPIVACVLTTVWLGTSFAPVDIVGMAMIIVMMVLMA